MFKFTIAMSLLLFCLSASAFEVGQRVLFHVPGTPATLDATVHSLTTNGYVSLEQLSDWSASEEGKMFMVQTLEPLNVVETLSYRGPSTTYTFQKGQRVLFHVPGTNATLDATVDYLADRGYARLTNLSDWATTERGQMIEVANLEPLNVVDTYTLHGHGPDRVFQNGQNVLYHVPLTTTTLSAKIGYLTDSGYVRLTDLSAWSTTESGKMALVENLEVIEFVK